MKLRAAMASAIEQLSRIFLYVILFSLSASYSMAEPIPAVWPEQFHALMFMNKSGVLQKVDLWYDWPNGRNFNIIQNQLNAVVVYDLEWTNGTSFIYTLHPSDRHCKVVQFPVGILRPNFLEGATYLGQEHVDNFLCNVWTKVDFIVYYEDVLTRRPVKWFFYSGLVLSLLYYHFWAIFGFTYLSLSCHTFWESLQKLLMTCS
jgi:hypothetical protein